MSVLCVRYPNQHGTGSMVENTPWSFSPITNLVFLQNNFQHQSKNNNFKTSGNFSKIDFFSWRDKALQRDERELAVKLLE